MNIECTGPSFKWSTHRKYNREVPCAMCCRASLYTLALALGQTNPNKYITKTFRFCILVLQKKKLLDKGLAISLRLKEMGDHKTDWQSVQWIVLHQHCVCACACVPACLRTCTRVWGQTARSAVAQQSSSATHCAYLCITSALALITQ